MTAGAPVGRDVRRSRRVWVSLDKVSPHLIDATVAVEDATFFTNPGVGAGRIAGAAIQNLQEGGIVSGASTITMQLARNLFLGVDQRYDQSFDRKVLEAGLAQELTDLYDKDELLEMYLNLLNYGQLAYGPEAAAQVYFGKSGRLDRGGGCSPSAASRSSRLISTPTTILRQLNDASVSCSI